jgi:hypothetical protein
LDWASVFFFGASRGIPPISNSEVNLAKEFWKEFEKPAVGNIRPRGKYGFGNGCFQMMELQEESMKSGLSRCVFAALILGALVLAFGCAYAQTVTVTADTMLPDFFGGGLGAPPRLFDVPGAKIPKCLGNFFGGAWVEFPVDAPKSGWYRVAEIEHAANFDQGDGFITIDTRPKDGSTHYVTKSIRLPNSGGWVEWMTTETQELVPLRQGANIVRVMNISKQLRRPDAVSDTTNVYGGGVNITVITLSFARDLEPMGTVTGVISSSDLKIPVGFGKVTTGSVPNPRNWWIEEFWTTADEQGKYALELPAGTYTLTGFRPDTYYPNRVSGVRVEAGRTTEAPEIKLQSKWKDGSLKQQARDIDKIIPGGATGFFDETNYNPIEPGESDDDTRIVTGWWDIGDWTEQLVDVPETGWYKVSIEFSSPDTNPVTVRYDANGLFTQGDLPGSGGWRDYKVAGPLEGAILLVKGTNRIRLTLIRGAFNESFHILTKTEGPPVGLLTGKVVRTDGKPIDPDIEVLTESGAGVKGVLRPGSDGVYKAYCGVGAYKLNISDILGYRIGDEVTGIEVKENQTTTVRDLRYTVIPFFLGVDPAKPAVRPEDDDFQGTKLSSKWTSYNLGLEDSGDAQVNNGILTTAATQVDFWGTADNGHLTYQKVKGDFIAYIKIVSIPTYEEMGDWSKHGLMVRLNDSPGSPHFTVLAGTGRRTINEYRMEQDGPTTSGAQPDESYRPGEWLKLVRKGGHFSAFWSYSDSGEPYMPTRPLDVYIPAFEGQDEVLLAVADTTGLGNVGTPAYATYSTFRFVPYDEAMKSLVPPPQPEVKPGDVNGDGKVGIPDATLALQMAVGILSPTPQQVAAGDLNKNGKIDIADVTRILRAAVGLEKLA